MSNQGSTSRSRARPDFIIGHDMSLTDSGVAILRADGTIADHRSFKTKASPVDHHRIDDIAERYFEFVNPYIMQGTVAAIFEDVQFSGKRSGKAGARFELLGVLRWNLRQQGIKIIGATPGAWVSHVIFPYKVPQTSKDRKRAVNNACKNKYNFYTENCNVSDAVGIARCGHAYLVLGQNITMRAMS